MQIKFNGAVSAILLSALLVSVFGCSIPAENKGAQSENSAESVSAVSDTETAEETMPELPDADFQGMKYNILMKGPDFVEWASQDIDVEALDGEVINDAVFERNDWVEDKYNVEIVGVAGSAGMAQTIKNSVSAGDGAFQFVTANMYDTASLATQKCLSDLYKVPNINLEADWWDQRANSDLSIDKKLFMTVNDILIMSNDATWLVIFSKELIVDYNLESPYNLVLGDNWYYDKMVEMTKGVTKDLDGNGVLDENDLYGHISQYENASGFILGFGEKVVSKDENDLPYLSIYNDRALGCIEKVFSFLTDRQYSINFQELSKYSRPFEVTQHMFEDNRGLFNTTAIQLVIRMRNMKTDFGIVPMPKLDEAQDTYYNFVHPTTSCISVPVSPNDLEITGTILEALAAKSHFTVRNAYYDVSLNYKYLRDEESIKMLDIILDTRMYDLSQIYNWGGIGSIFFDMMQKKDYDFSSIYAKREKQAEKDIKKTIDAYLDMK